MDLIKPGWFTEIEKDEHHCFSLQVEKVLYEGKSKYQDVLVFNK